VRVAIARTGEEVTLLKRKTHAPEQIVRKLREAERLQAEVGAVCRHPEVSVQTFQRWRSQFTPMRPAAETTCATQPQRRRRSPAASFRTLKASRYKNIREATGLNGSYLALIRAGRRTPYPRHWTALLTAVEKSSGAVYELKLPRYQRDQAKATEIS
jgi:hypothetical protein